MSDLTTQATHDYLKAIYEICEHEGRASTGRIADELGITPASVTGMLKKLAGSEPPLLDYRKHRGVVLTEAGEKQALKTIRRHRLLECFLHETLGYRWDEVHDEAERLEHAVSGAFGRKIAELLQEPVRDPHGAPIPSADLSMPPDESVALDKVDAGHRVRLQRVNDRDPDLLRYVDELGLRPGTAFVVLPALPFSDHVCIQRDERGETIIISAKIAEALFVTVQEGQGSAAASPRTQHESD